MLKPISKLSDLRILIDYNIWCLYAFLYGIVCTLTFIVHYYLKRFIFKQKNVVCRIGGFTWDLNDFCRGWIITGKTGSGKTTAAVNRLMEQVSMYVPNWGGLVIDEKGSYVETLKSIFKKTERLNDCIILAVMSEASISNLLDLHTFNIFESNENAYGMCAKLICDTVNALGQRNEQAFFRIQAQLHIEKAFIALKLLGSHITFSKCLDLLSSRDSLMLCLDRLNYQKSSESATIVKHFETNFLSQPERQLSSIQATIFNYLQFFAHSEIEKVLCSETPTVKLTDLDKGKVICLSIAQAYHEERKYLNVLMKLLFYKHALKRFDLSETERMQKNLLILWADEARKVVTASEDGLSDYNVVDQLREARTALVAATQSYQSLIPPIGDYKKTQVFIANLANRITFSAADEESAQMAAQALGKKKARRQTISYQKGGRSYTYTDEERFHIEPYEIRGLKKFEAIVQHCDKGFRKVKLKPIIVSVG